jgi:O-antigen/teichoic acid export membrane protein
MQDAPESSPIQRLIAHGGIYAASRMASHLAVFLLVPLYAHALGSEGLGVVEVTNAVRDVLVMVMLQGTPNAMMRLRFDIQGERELQRFESTLTWYVAATGFGLCGVMWLLGGPFWTLVGEGMPFTPFGILTFAIAAASAVCQLLDRKLQADQQAAKLAVITLVRTVLILGAIVVFVVPLGRGAAGKLEAEAIVTIAAAVSAWVMLAPGSPRGFSMEHLKRGLAWGFPLVPHAIVALVNSAIDRLMINALLGLSAAGVFAMGFRVASITVLMMTTLNQALMPLFIESMRKLTDERDPVKTAALQADLAKLSLVFLTLGALLVQGVTALGPTLIALLGTEEFKDSWRVLAPIGASALAWTCYAIFGHAVTYTRQGLRAMSWITLFATLVHVALGFVLIPWLGIEGAAWGTFLSTAVQAWLCLKVGQRYAPVRHAWPRWIGLLAASAVGLALQTWIELELTQPLVRWGLKAAWVAFFAYATLRIADVKLRDLRPRAAHA